jgi:hypothetical protein
MQCVDFLKRQFVSLAIISKAHPLLSPTQNPVQSMVDKHRLIDGEICVGCNESNNSSHDFMPRMLE